MKKVVRKISSFIKNFCESKTKRELYTYSLLFLVVLFSLYKTVTYSRYMFENIKDSYLLSKEFFFISDVLDGSTYQLNDWDGENDYSFAVDLENYFDELRWTNVDIPYDVTIGCTSSISGDVSCVANDGTLEYSPINGTRNRINVTLSNPNELNFRNGDYVTMTFSVKSLSPYEKTLSATYRINVSTNTLSYVIADSANQKYLDLLLSNYTNQNKDVTLNWDYTLLSLDNTNQYVLLNERSIIYNNVSHANSITITVPAKSTYSIRYYKTDITEDYTYPITNPSSIISVS